MDNQTVIIDDKTRSKDRLNNLGGTIYRQFGNMDMGFQTLYEMFSSLGYETWKDWQSRIRYRYI